MTDDVRQNYRLDSIEARLARVEEQLGLSAAPSESAAVMKFIADGDKLGAVNRLHAESDLDFGQAKDLVEELMGG